MSKLLKLPRSLVASLFAAGLAAALPSGAMAQARLPGSIQPGGGGGNSAIAQAAKQQQDAEATVKAARDAQKRARDKVEAQFKTKDEWVKTQQAATKAKQEADAARNRIMQTLAANADYKATKTGLDAVDVKMRAAQEGKGEDLDHLAQERTTLGVKLNAMQTAALEADPKYLDAKNRHTEAQKKQSELQSEVDAAAQSDPDCMAAQQQVEQAQQQLDQAKASLAQARKSEADARAAKSKTPTGTKAPRPR